MMPSWPYFQDPQIRSVHRFHRDGLHSQEVETSMHTGTHVDAPLHFNPEGWDAASIPLSQLMGEGVVVDISDAVSEWSVIEPEQVEREAPVRQGDILVLHTGWHEYCYVGRKANEEKYFDRHPGPLNRFADWVVEKRLKWVGMDTPAVEHPLNTAIRRMRQDLVEEFERRRGRKIDDVLPRETWLYVHKRTAKENILLVENLEGQIDDVLGRRLWLAAFPWRFVKGEASICRVLAFEW